LMFVPKTPLSLADRPIRVSFERQSLPIDPKLRILFPTLFS
jgi:hypothetical protein